MRINENEFKDIIILITDMLYLIILLKYDSYVIIFSETSRIILFESCHLITINNDFTYLHPPSVEF